MGSFCAIKRHFWCLFRLQDNYRTDPQTQGLLNIHSIEMFITAWASRFRKDSPLHHSYEAQTKLHCTDLDPAFAHSDLFDVSCLLRNRKCPNTEFSDIHPLFMLLPVSKSIAIFPPTNFLRVIFCNSEKPCLEGPCLLLLDWSGDIKVCQVLAKVAKATFGRLARDQSAPRVKL